MYQNIMVSMATSSKVYNNLLKEEERLKIIL